MDILCETSHQYQTTMLLERDLVGNEPVFLALEADSDACIGSWSAHSGEVYTVCFSVDERSCFSMGGDGKVLITKKQNAMTLCNVFDTWLKIVPKMTKVYRIFSHNSNKLRLSHTTPHVAQ